MAESLTLDLNCDMGESFGRYHIGHDEAVMPLISSANIACGFHGGDPKVMAKTVRLALDHRVAIGAHPGFPDLNGFGRRKMDIPADEIEQIVLYQIGALSAIVRAEGGSLYHVKPHGALYNMAAKDRSIADAIVRAIYRFDENLVLYGLSGSELINAAESQGLKVAREVFADRRYLADGRLVPRSDNRGVIDSTEQALNQLYQLVVEGSVSTLDGTVLPVQAETVCIHGDTDGAPLFARALNHFLEKQGITLAVPHALKG